MSKSLITAIFLFLVLKSGISQAQDTPQTPVPPGSAMTEEALATYKKQATQMVSFMEFAFNTLGSSKPEYKEKDIIINQSYLKIFKDSKVQIEDDLVEKRDVVTNKDVQAYLKDIDFFFTDVVFKFTVEEITQELNEKGEVFFKVKTSRNIQGTTIEGKKVNDNKPRFIEINLDDAKGELKIVSIYTTRSGEEQELISWWNSLDSGWRKFFSGNVMVLDSIPLKDIASLGIDYIFIYPEGIAKEDSAFFADTVKVNTAAIFTEIRKILRTEKIDISGVKGIFDLEPLSGLTLLKHLNISGASVSGLEPVRNLSKLETLIASGSLIASLLPLQYSSNLQHLDISSTFITDLSPAANFRQLETLDISGLQIDSILPVLGLESLKELHLNQAGVRSLEGIEKLSSLELLEISGTAITDLTPVGKLSKLQRLSIEKTYISDLGSLSSLTALEYIYLDNTTVSDLSPLKSIPSLKAVYCDKSLVTREEALDFLQARPGVKVIYESEELSAWWQKLSDEWKKVFRSFVTLDNEPTREQLHELTYLKKIDISGKKLITVLEPLKKMAALEELFASQSGIKDIVAVKELLNLRILDISSCEVADLSPVFGLKSMQSLNISSTKITDLKAIAGLRNLRSLSVENCAIASFAPLMGLSRLEIVFAEGVPAIANNVGQLWDSIPDALIIYQTVRIRDWWNGLSEPWKAVFNSIEPMGNTPSPEQLHRVASLRTLDLTESRNITDLFPLRMLARLENLNISRLPVYLMALSLNSRLLEFNCSDTPVTDLLQIASHRRIKNLYLSNTQIDDIDVVEGFANLEILDISGTQVTRLNAVANCSRLKQLDCYNTRINSLKALEAMPELKLLRIYNTRVSSKNIEKYKIAHPGVEVVYY